MSVLVAFLGLLLILTALLDGFETVILPRRVTRNVRLARLFYEATWSLWSALVRPIREGSKRETLLSFYAPLSLLILLAVWAALLVVGFAALQWALGSQVVQANAPGGRADFAADLYMSGSTFFTLGLGDVAPIGLWPRVLAIVEAGTGFAFLGVIIGYLPGLTQAFSRREVDVALLDQRAGSPPTASELLRRYGPFTDTTAAYRFLREWEKWAAELLESHISYPVLCYFRSQHENQSWVAALTMVLDACALGLTGVEGVSKREAQLTFAMARHAAVDISQILDTPPQPPNPDRLPPTALAELRARLASAGVRMAEGEEADRTLKELRADYEPYVNALASHLLMPIPPWLPAPDAHDAWQSSAWGKTVKRET